MTTQTLAPRGSVKVDRIHPQSFAGHDSNELDHGQSDKFKKASTPQIASRISSPVNRRAIFEQPWWLLAASCGAIERVEVKWDNAIVGSLFYQPSHRFMVRKAVKPAYTRVLAPYLSGPSAKPATQIANNTKIIGELYDQIKGFDLYATTVRASEADIIPFQMNDFDIGAKFTFLSPPETSLAAVRQGMSQKIRNLLNSAEERFSIEMHFNLDCIREILHLHEDGDRNDYAALANIVDAVKSRDAGIILSAVDEHGVSHAAALVIWDHERLYYLVSARRAGAIANKASALVFYESIALAKQKGLAFDADGYATVDSARALIKWGLPPSMNYNISKGSLLYSTLKPAKERFKRSPF